MRIQHWRYTSPAPTPPALCLTFPLKHGVTLKIISCIVEDSIQKINATYSTMEPGHFRTHLNNQDIIMFPGPPIMNLEPILWEGLALQKPL